MSIVCIDFDCVVPVGDFDIHVDNLNDGRAKELLNILDNFGLSMDVMDSMHNMGHILDVIISKGPNVSEVVVTNIALSDHYCVLFKTTTPAYLNKNESESFILLILITQAFTPSSTLPSASADDLANSFSSKVMALMDLVAPIRTKVLTHCYTS